MRIAYTNKTCLRIDDDEMRTIVGAIFDNQANIMQTAHELGISRNNLYDKIRLYKLWPIIIHLRKEKRRKLDLAKKSGRI